MNSDSSGFEQTDGQIRENGESAEASLPPVHLQPDDLNNLKELLLEFDGLEKFRVEVKGGGPDWSGSVEEFLNDHDEKSADFSLWAQGKERSVLVQTIRPDTEPSAELNLTVDGFPAEQRETVVEVVEQFVEERSDARRSTVERIVRWGSVSALPGGLLLGSSVGGFDVLPPANPGNVLLALGVGLFVGFFLASVLDLYHPWAAIYSKRAASNQSTLAGRVKIDVIRVASAVREVSPVDFVRGGEHAKVVIVGYVFRLRKSADVTPFAVVMFVLTSLSFWLTLRSDTVRLVLNLCGIGA